MYIDFIDIVRCVAGVVAGGVIGISFGFVQELAHRRHQRRQNRGEFSSGWAVMPSSMRRVAGLLVALVLIQVACPVLFTDGIRWWVSGGLVAGYGVTLFRQFRQSRA